MISEHDKQKGTTQLKAIAAAFFVMLVAGKLCSFLCSNDFFGGIAGFGLAIVVYMVIVGQALGDVSVLKPPSKLYNLTPLKVLSELKELFATKYINAQKWQMNSLNQEKMTMVLTFNFERETPAPGDPGGGGGLKTQRKKSLLSLSIGLERVGEGTAVSCNYELVDGELDFDTQAIMKQTTEVIDITLKNKAEGE
ncbi:MAG TPA: hypothetical protein V6C86_22060 [Oculatellaceae cyanobacterium]